MSAYEDKGGASNIAVEIEKGVRAENVADFAEKVIAQKGEACAKKAHVSHVSFS